jgi:hypothetical protein
MVRARQRVAERVAVHGRIVDPAAKRRWNQAHKLVRYGLTREQFDRLPWWTPPDPESGRLSSFRAVGAAGARLPDTEKVTGSNPVRPTKLKRKIESLKQTPGAIPGAK